MQPKQIKKRQQLMMQLILLKRVVNLVNLKTNLDKLDIGKLKIVPSRLNSLKSKADKWDIGKLETTPFDLSTLSNVVKNDVVKKTKYNEIIEKFDTVQATDTSNLVIKADLTQKASETENKINDHDHTEYIITQDQRQIILQHD